jgi:hypothetical protein
MSLLITAIGIIFSIAILLCVKKLIHIEGLKSFLRKIFSLISGLFGVGVFAAVLYLGHRFKLMPGAVFFVFLVLFFISKKIIGKKKKIMNDQTFGYDKCSLFRTFLEPMYAYVTFGMIISGSIVALMQIAMLAE